MTVHDTKSFLPALSQQASQAFAPLQREIDRVFSDFSRGFSSLEAFGPSLDMDLCESGDGIELTVEVPGMKQEDIKVTVEDDLLTVSGEKRSEVEDKRRNYRFVERRYGAFKRSVALPRGVDAEKVKATLTDGVLKITAPKVAGQSGRTVAIQAGKA